MAKVFVVLGIVLSAYGLCLCALSNLNLGVVSIVLLGAGFFAYGFFYEKVNFLTQSGVLKYVKAAVVTMLCAELVLVGFIAVYGQRDNVTYKEEAVIVLGAGLRGDKVTLPLKLRLDKAVEYSRKNPDAFIVVSGGQGFQETVTEAYAMEKYLIEKGVGKDRILKEEKSTSTNENMRFSKAILDKRFKGKYEIAVITNNFHIYRGTQIGKIEGFETVKHMHAGLQWYNLMPCYIRESLAVLKMWVLG